MSLVICFTACPSFPFCRSSYQLQYVTHPLHNPLPVQDKNAICYSSSLLSPLARHACNRFIKKEARANPAEAPSSARDANTGQAPKGCNVSSALLPSYMDYLMDIYKPSHAPGAPASRLDSPPDAARMFVCVCWWWDCVRREGRTFSSARHTLRAKG